jgi:hypothetical protein
MKKLFVILALFLLLAACESKHEEQKQCFKVTFSDALPVQFWLNDCPTYNETTPEGVHYKCFCHPWSCDDELKVQFTDDDVDQDYTLLIKNSESEIISSIPFYKDINRAVLELENNSFEDTILPWVSSSGSGTQNWAWTAFNGGSAQVGIGVSGGGNNVSRELSQFFDFQAGKTYTFTITGQSLLLDADVGIKVRLKNQAILYTITSTEYFIGSTFTQVIDITPTQDCNQVAIEVRNINPAITNTVNLYEVTLLADTVAVYTADFVPTEEGACETIQLEIISNSSPEETIAKTDCIEVYSYNSNPTLLIEYSNTRNFNGLIYEDVSPETVFQTRIPAIFFHERFPSDREVAELSNSQIINLNSALRKQRLLETDYLPYYMHQKIQLILMHDNVVINGKNWTYNEAYELVEGERRWPVKKGKVYLNQADFVQRNVI